MAAWGPDGAGNSRGQPTSLSALQDSPCSRHTFSHKTVSNTVPAPHGWCTPVKSIRRGVSQQERGIPMRTWAETEKRTLRMGRITVTLPVEIAASLQRQAPPTRRRMRRAAIAVSITRDIANDLQQEGHHVIADIATPRPVPPAYMPYIAMDASLAIDRIRRAVRAKTLWVALCCPVAIAFMMGILLGHHSTYRLLHWENGYKSLPAYSLDRFRKRCTEIRQST